MIYLINLESLCERYSCLPKDILEEDAFFISAFQSIVKGKQKGMESKGKPQNNITPKQLKRGFG